MNRLPVSNAITFLLIATTTTPITLATAAFALSTNSPSVSFTSLEAVDFSKLQQLDRAATNSQQVTNMLVSVAPDWLSKLPRVKAAISQEVAAHLKNIYARGNRRDAWVEALEARGTKVYMRAKVRHHHVWSAPFGRKVTMYSLTNTIEISFDPLNPLATMDKSRLCFNLPPQVGGKVCASGTDLAKIIVMFL